MATQGKKTNRKRISEELLAERLGLHDDWIECWEENGVWKEECSAPDQLPEFVRNSRRKTESLVDRLVAAGCQRRVIYFCIAQLSPEAERIRSGGGWKSVPDKRAQGEDNALHRHEQKLATREDMEAVVNNAKATRKLIQRYQRELLLVADTGGFPVPAGLMTKLEHSEDALALLENSLTWIVELAGAYTAPMETTLLKSKGLLYLTLYVSQYARSKKLRSSKVKGVLKESRRASGDLRARSSIIAPGNVLAEVANTCTGESWAPSDLNRKLATFRAEHPRLYNEMKSKLDALHQYFLTK